MTSPDRLRQINHVLIRVFQLGLVVSFAASLVQLFEPLYTQPLLWTADHLLFVCGGTAGVSAFALYAILDEYGKKNRGRRFLAWLFRYRRILFLLALNIFLYFGLATFGAFMHWFGLWTMLTLDALAFVAICLIGTGWAQPDESLDKWVSIQSGRKRRIAVAAWIASARRRYSMRRECPKDSPAASDNRRLPEEQA